MTNWILVLMVAIGMTGCGKRDGRKPAADRPGAPAAAGAAAQGGELPATPVARPVPDQAGQPDSPDQPDNAGTEGTAARDALPADARVEPEQDRQPAAACVTDCVRRNQMRAVGPEQIESDCRAECAEKGE